MDYADMTRTSNLRRARQRAKVSPDALADRAGVSRMTYYRDEQPGASIPRERAELYAAALGVTPAYVMGWEADFGEVAA